jgi:hypothetical protein
MTNLIEYGRAAQLRGAVSALASSLIDRASDLVPTDGDGWAHGGEMAEAAYRIAQEAHELLALTVAHERHRGTSWARIGESLGEITRQAAQDRYGETTAAYDRLMVKAWLLRAAPGGMPEGAGTTEDLEVLDRRTARRGYRAERPVSGALLTPMALAEFHNLVVAGHRLLSRLRAEDTEAAELHALEAGFLHRRVELYEMRTAAGIDDPDLPDLLAAARARLTEHLADTDLLAGAREAFNAHFNRTESEEA